MRILLIGTDGAADWQPRANEHSFAFFDGFDEIERASDRHAEWVRAHCRRYSQLDKAISDFQPDLAAVYVPNFAKNNLAYEIFLMKKGTPIYEGKLRLRSHADYNTLRLHAQNSAGAFWIGEFYRYHPCVVAAKQILDSGVIGKAEQMRWHCGIQGEPSAWETAYTRLALEDLAYHHFSAMHWLLGLTGASIMAQSASPAKAAPLLGTVCDTWMTTKAGCRITHSIDWHSTIAVTDYLGDFHIDGTLGGLAVAGGKLFHMAWGSEKTEVPLTTNISQKAIDHLPFWEPDPALQLWTLSDFLPVMDCIYTT